MPMTIDQLAAATGANTHVLRFVLEVARRHVARGMNEGYVTSRPEEDRTMTPKAKFEDEIAARLGGRAAEELIATPPPGVVVLNRAFDLTPLDAVTWIISERDVLPGADASAACDAIDVHSLLR